MKKILICSDDYKKKHLNDLSKLNILNKFVYMNLTTLKHRLFFKIPAKAILFASEYLKVKYSVAVSITNELYFLNSNLNHPNLNKLKDLKEKLIENNLLEFDDFFKEYLKKYSIEVNQANLTKSDYLVLDEAKKYTSVVVNKVEYTKKDLVATEYQSIEDEIEGLFYNILNLSESVNLN